MKDKSPSIDINPIKGVTPEQLLYKAKYLITAIPLSHDLTTIEKKTIINDAVTNVYLKMEQGKVPKFDYSDFKGYLFITIKSGVALAWQKRKRQKNAFYNGFEELDTIVDCGDSKTTRQDYEPAYQPDYNPEDEVVLEYQTKMVKKAISMLSVLKQKMISEVLNGAKPVAVCRKYKMNTAYINQIREELKRKARALVIADKTGHLIPRFQKQIDHQPQLCEFEAPNDVFDRKSFILGEKIMQLHMDGCTYHQIQSILHCSKSTVNYYIDPNGKEKVMERQRRNRAKKKLA